MLSTKLQKDLMDAYQKVYEDKRGHAAGDSDLEKQASQLASDVRYKAKGKSKPGASKEELRKLFISILGASPAPSAVKAMAKDKLLGEEVVTEMRFNDGKSGERLKALAKKRKIPMSKMKNHPQFKDDVKEGMGQEMFDKSKIGGAGRQIKKKAVELPKFKNTDNPDYNKTLGNPIETYMRNPKGDLVAQIGNIHMTGVSNYWNIEQISNESGATKQLAGGFSKREVFDWYDAALEGIFLYQK